MLNIIRADLYRIVRGKGFYITGFLLILFIVLQTSASNTGTIGIHVYENTDTIPSQVLESETFTGIIAPFKMMEVGDNLLYFLLPYIIFIIGADFSSGTVKNILAGGMSRVKYYFAKLILLCTFCICIFSLNIILPIITATMMNGFGGTFGMEFIKDVARPFFAQLLLYIGIACVGTFFVFATKRTAAVNAAYIAFCSLPLLLMMILLNIDDSLKFLFNYDVIMNIRGFAHIDAMSGADITRALSMGVFYILASTMGGLLLFKKSVIK